MGALMETDAGKARGKNAEKAAAGTAQYLTFMLGGEMFAIGILAIKEIIEYPALTSVPMVPDVVRGVINLRGAVVTIMDLSVRFGRKATPVTKRTCIVIVEVEEGDERQVIGVVVDAVNAVLEIAPDDIAPPPSFGAKIRSEFIQGMAKANDKFVIVLDVDKVFSIEEISGLTELAAAADVPAAAIVG